MPRELASAGGASPHVPAVAAAEPAQQEWEYEILEELGTDPKARLNELGKDGWALITAHPFIFRRPRKSDEKPRSPVGFGRG